MAMRRRRPGALTSLLLATAAAAVTELASPASATYNVLFIAVDDLKPTVGAFGDLEASTPYMDDLLSRGTTFQSMSCSMAICGPSRASLIAGRHVDALRTWAFQPTFRKVSPELMTLPGHLRQKTNHRAVGVGKILDNRNFNTDGDLAPDLCGQDTYLNADMVHCSWDEYISPKQMRQEPICNGQTALRWATEDPEDWDQYNQFEAVILELDNITRHEDYCIGLIGGEKLVELAANASEEPFFLAVGFVKPHLPWTGPRTDFEFFRTDPDSTILPPPEILTELDENSFWTDQSSDWTRPSSNAELEKYTGWDSYDSSDLVRAYYAATKFVDRQIGKLIDVLNNDIDATVRDNTMIILWGDNGYHLGEFGLWGKKTVLENSARVPCGIVAPPAWAAKAGNEVQKGGHSDSPTDTVDLYPTVLDILGVDAPDHTLSGTSLVPIMKNSSAQVRAASLNEYKSYENSNYMGYSIRTQSYRLIVYMKLKSGTGKFVLDTQTNMELYHYGEPGAFETINRIDDENYADVKAEMLALIGDPSDPDWTQLLGVAPFDA